MAVVSKQKKHVRVCYICGSAVTGKSRRRKRFGNREICSDTCDAILEARVFAKKHPPSRSRPTKGMGEKVSFAWQRCLVCKKYFTVPRKRRRHLRGEWSSCSNQCMLVLKAKAAAKGRVAAKKALKQSPKKICEVCGREYQPSRTLQKYCCVKCGSSVHNSRRSLFVDKAKADNISLNVVYDRDGGVCQLCLKKVDERIRWPNPKSGTVDHIVPLSKGGSHTYDNTQLAHLRCNASKHDKLIGQKRLF